ncbi:MAG: hemolysin family protein [Rhizomicrobium sp.]
MFLEIAVIVVLILVNGLFAMTEIAVVSSRPMRLKRLAQQGSRGAEAALQLAGAPGPFLSSVQIGITLVGILSGVFSGATLGVRLAGWLGRLGWSEVVADAVGYGAMVAIITYLSLIVGELVPKQIALAAPEKMASRVAPAMIRLMRAAAPLIWLLDKSGRLLLKLLGSRAVLESQVTEEEVKTIIAEATSAGVLESGESEMIAGVMRFADRRVRALMTPRREVEFLDLAADTDVLRQQILETPFSRLPVRDGDADALTGVVVVRDALAQLARGEGLDLRALVKSAPVVMDSADAFGGLALIRAAGVHIALVFDEYGSFEGVLSTGDILKAITGATGAAADEPDLVLRKDGSYLISGSMPIDEFGDNLGVVVDADAGYATVAGFVLNALGHIPVVGECFSHGPWQFEVVDLDGLRIDKIIASRTEN